MKEREAILQVLRANPHSGIRAFHRGHPDCYGYTEGKLLIENAGSLIPNEIVQKPIMFLKVQNDLYLSGRWHSDFPGG